MAQQTYDCIKKLRAVIRQNEYKNIERICFQCEYLGISVNRKKITKYVNKLKRKDRISLQKQRLLRAARIRDTLSALRSKEKRLLNELNAIHLKCCRISGA